MITNTNPTSIKTAYIDFPSLCTPCNELAKRIEQIVKKAFSDLMDWISFSLSVRIMPALLEPPAEPNTFDDLDIDKVQLTTADGVELTARLCKFKASRYVPDQKWLIYCNGNAGTSACAGWYVFGCAAEISENLPGDEMINTLLVDYRGVNGNPQFPRGFEDLVLDGSAAVEFLLKNGVQPENIHVHGYSLGGATAIRLAEKYPGICASSVFAPSSIPEAARQAIISLCPPDPEKFGSRSLHAVLKVVGAICATILKQTRWNTNIATSLKNIQGRFAVIHNPLDPLIVPANSLAKAAEAIKADCVTRIHTPSHNLPNTYEHLSTIAQTLSAL